MCVWRVVNDSDWLLIYVEGSENWGIIIIIIFIIIWRGGCNCQSVFNNQKKNFESLTSVKNLHFETLNTLVAVLIVGIRCRFTRTKGFMHKIIVAWKFQARQFKIHVWKYEISLHENAISIHKNENLAPGMILLPHKYPCEIGLYTISCMELFIIEKNIIINK